MKFRIIFIELVGQCFFTYCLWNHNELLVFFFILLEMNIDRFSKWSYCIPNRTSTIISNFCMYIYPVIQSQNVLKWVCRALPTLRLKFTEILFLFLRYAFVLLNIFLNIKDKNRDHNICCYFAIILKAFRKLDLNLPLKKKSFQTVP